MFRSLPAGLIFGRWIFSSARVTEVHEWRVLLRVEDSVAEVTPRLFASRRGSIADYASVSGDERFEAGKNILDHCVRCPANQRCAACLPVERADLIREDHARHREA